MSSNQSTVKWVAGCAVLFVVAVVVCGGLAVWLIGRAGESIGGFYEEQRQRADFAARWTPPPDDAGPESLFPETVGAVTLSGHDDRARIGKFRIDLDGRHASYQSANGTVDVFVYRLNKLEKEAVLERMKEAIKNNYAFASLDLGHYARCDYTTTSPKYEQGILWWASDWLFLFRTGEKIDLDPFAEAYLTAIQPAGQQSQDDPPADQPAGTDTDGRPPRVD